VGSAIIHPANHTRFSMRYTLLFATAIAGAVSLWSPSAHAGSYAANDINMRAGPSTHYPSIGIVPEGTALNVYGCTRGYRWCDVAASGQRGWVSAAYIEIDYDARRVRVPAYAHVAPEPVAPTVSFNIHTYWSSHYPDQDFYDQIDSWDDYDWESDAPPPGWESDW
jgi:uncharacterized protein YraI